LSIYMSRAELEEISEGLITAYANKFSNRVIQSIDIEHFITEFLMLRIEYASFAEDDAGRIGFLADGATPLLVHQDGKIIPFVFPKDTIVLDKFLLAEKEQGRRRFTMAHEASHHILSKMYAMPSEGRFHAEYDSERSYSKEELAQMFASVEWQADTMGASLLMPRRIIENALAKYNQSNPIRVYGDNTITSRLLVGNATDLHSIECYDPSAGTGTLLMALAHKIGEDKCTIFAQDISQRSNKMLKLNLILNSLVSSLDHAIQGDTLIAPYHKSDNGQELRTFDYVVSNPPFKMDFSDTRERIAAMPVRFWAGVPKVPAKKKESMAIYTLFIQHVLNSLKSTGKGAIVVPTGFVTAKSGVEKKILQHIVDEHIVYGCISMPSNVFANTGTNVSVLFFDNSRKTDKVVLIDASKLGEEYKDGNNQKRRLRDFEIDKIVDTFLNKEAVDDFSVAVTYDEIKEKKYSLAAGQYFDVKIEYVELSQDEFNARMSAYAEKLQEYFAEGDKLKTEIMEQLKKVKYE
jgi:methylase of polypeptide subunit release factors